MLPFYDAFYNAQYLATSPGSPYTVPVGTALIITSIVNTSGKEFILNIGNSMIRLPGDTVLRVPDFAVPGGAPTWLSQLDGTDMPAGALIIGYESQVRGDLVLFTNSLGNTTIPYDLRGARVFSWATADINGSHVNHIVQLEASVDGVSWTDIGGATLTGLDGAAGITTDARLIRGRTATAEGSPSNTAVQIFTNFGPALGGP